MTMLLICFIFNIFWKDDKGHVTHDLCHQELIVHFFKDFIYLFLERQERREKEEEKHQCVVASCMPPTRDLAHNPGMCSDWESNW